MKKNYFKNYFENNSNNKISENLIEGIKATKRLSTSIKYHDEIISIYNNINFYKETNYIPIAKLAYDVRDKLTQDILDWAKTPVNRQIFVLGCNNDVGHIILQYLKNLTNAVPRYMRFDENARAITRKPISVYDWRQSSFTSRFDDSQIKAAKSPRHGPRLRIYVLGDYIPAITTQFTETRLYDIRLKINRQSLEKMFFAAITWIKSTIAPAYWRGTGASYRYTVDALVAKIREFRVHGLRIWQHAPRRIITNLLFRYYTPLRITMRVDWRKTRVRCIDLPVIGTATAASSKYQYSRVGGAPTLVEDGTIGKITVEDKFRDIDEEEIINMDDLWVRDVEEDIDDFNTAINNDENNIKLIHVDVFNRKFLIKPEFKLWRPKIDVIWPTFVPETVINGYPGINFKHPYRK